ncbi:MAG: UDP-N-acetylglucosamine 2-epimerase (non-hydrolyzing) [Epsilonproteobacteria bacterium]|nr:UDP-N-acetylglucosamine 2-epimerase (non-hydrolyzing) [Campylobacterota bacterium]
MDKPIVIVVGTRPEALKLIPLYCALQKAQLPVLLCATFQHTTLLQQVFDLFSITPDINLNIMQHDQSLHYLTQAIIEKMGTLFKLHDPSLLIVQGDTTTAFASALATFYKAIPIAHVEAGLRSGKINNPFPEEMNRVMIGKIATYHFAPTNLNVANLLNEGISRDHIFLTGNTIVDTLLMICDKIKRDELSIDAPIKAHVAMCKKLNKKLILMTLHRRENFDGKLVGMLEAVKEFAQRYDDVNIIFPAHLNPNVQKALKTSMVDLVANITTIPPVAYKELVYILQHAHWVITDSGGIQEEAVSLGKPLLVLRNETERPELLWENAGRLTGTNKTKILQDLETIHTQDTINVARNTYGDGHACQRITSIIKNIILESAPQKNYTEQNIKPLPQRENTHFLSNH